MNKVVKRIVWVLVALLVIFLILYPKIDFSGKSEESETASSGAAGSSSSIPVEVSVVEPRSLDYKLNITGSVQANEFVDLKPEVAGMVTLVNFKEGQRVKKGQLLVELNNDDLKAELEKLKFQKNLNEQTEYRQSKLIEKEAISQEEYDIALNDLNITKSEIAVLEAQLAKTRVRAPFDGIVGLRFVSPGSYVTTNDIIASFADVDPIKVDFSVPGKYASSIKTGSKITFFVEGYEQKFEARVYAIDPRIDLETRTLSMRALTSNKGGVLLPGQFAKVELIMSTNDNALILPSEAVVPELAGHLVYVVKNNKVKEQKVKIGLRTDREIEIIEGIQPSDTVIVTGVQLVKEGVSVDIRKVVS